MLILSKFMILLDAVKFFPLSEIFISGYPPLDTKRLIAVNNSRCLDYGKLPSALHVLLKA